MAESCHAIRPDLICLINIEASAGPGHVVVAASRSVFRRLDEARDPSSLARLSNVILVGKRLTPPPPPS
jgi:hypothetical protein